jgi:hypothetical protein
MQSRNFIFILLLSGGALLCMTSSTNVLVAQSQSFIDEAVLRGVDFPFTEGAPGYGSGLAAVDLDQDGDADLVLPGIGGDISILKNDGTGHFTDLSNTLDLPEIQNGRGVAAGDVDGDGDLDLLILCVGEKNRLLRNDGDFNFTDVSENSGLTHVGNTSSAAFGDLNGDGWIDLLEVCIASGSAVEDNVISYNNGDGTFSQSPVQIPGRAIPQSENHTFQGLLQDFDLDGDLDIYLSNDRGNSTNAHNWMLENQQGNFIDMSNLGSGVSIDSMGIAAADVNLDGFPDIYCTNYSLTHPLLINEGGFSFNDAATDYGVDFGMISWGTCFFDLGLDGDLDLFVLDSSSPNRMFEQQGIQQWLDVAPDLGLDANGFAYCGVPVDIDLDGDIDLITTEHFGPVHIYIQTGVPSNNFIRLDPVAPYPNHFAIGSRIELRDDNGVLFHSAQRAGGDFYKSVGEMIVHHGLGSAESVAQLTIYFPDGESRNLTDLPANQTWKLYHPDLLGDENGNGSVDLEDCQQFLQVSSGAFGPGSAIFDFDGNSTLDLFDLEWLVSLYDGVLSDCDSDGISDLMELYLGTMVDSDGDNLPDSCDSHYLRGDVNIDLSLDVADPIELLQHLFFGTPCPCFAAVDVNDDEQVNIADPVALLGYLFNSGPAPHFPFPDCGNGLESLTCIESGCP